MRGLLDFVLGLFRNGNTPEYLPGNYVPQKHIFTNVYTSGAKAGKLVVNAYKPVRFLFSRQGRRNYQPGGTAYAIAMDYDRSYLIFPYQKDQYIYVPLYEAVNFAANMGLGNNPEMLTGLCWNLRITDRKNNQCLASPLEILTE